MYVFPRCSVLAGVLLLAASDVHGQDHLQCFKIKDPLRLQALVDLSSPQFGLAPGCRVSRAALFCVPAAKTVVTAIDRTGLPITPLPITGPDPGDRICYEVRCRGAAPAPQLVSDQFGSRTIVRGATSLLCTPAIKGVPTTTSTTTTSTTSSTVPPASPCINPGPPVACATTISGSITADMTLPGGCDTFLSGLVVVEPGVELFVQPGAVVKGITNPLDPAVLVVRRHGRICAPGTPEEPIVFTSDRSWGSRGIADWGGISLSGNAPANCTTCDAPGLPPGTAPFGGPDPADSSGVLTFVRIEYAGFELGPDSYLSLLTMNGVGTGTRIDHVQANAGLFDCFQWNGGTVKAKHLVATACRDDGFDWQRGWRGSVQFALTHQNGVVISTCPPSPIGCRHGIEADNSRFGFDDEPRSSPVVCNATLVGPLGNFPMGLTGSGVQLRRGTAGIVSNAIVEDWPWACLDLDDDATLARACTGPTMLRTGPDVLLVQDSICHNNGPGGGQQVTGTSTSPPCTPAQAYGLWATHENLVPAVPTTVGPDAGLNTWTYPAVADGRYLPSAPQPGPDCAVLDPTFFDSAPYLGAFAFGGPNWLLDARPCAHGQVGGCWISYDLN